MSKRTQNNHSADDANEIVFLSFSGPTGKVIAEALKDWLPLVFDSILPYVASEMQSGTKWTSDVHEHLDKAILGISCVTRDSQEAPWLMFEAGYIAGRHGQAGKNHQMGLLPYVVGMESEEVRGPFSSLFHITIADRSGTLSLIKTINTHRSKPMGDRILEGRFDSSWEKLESDLKQIRTPFFRRSTRGRLVEAEKTAATIRAYNDTLHAEVGAEVSTKAIDCPGADADAYLRATVLLNLRKGLQYEYILAKRPWASGFEMWLDQVVDQMGIFRRIVQQNCSESATKQVRVWLLATEAPLQHVSIDLYELETSGLAGFWCVDTPTSKKPDNVFEVFDTRHLHRCWSQLLQIAKRYGASLDLSDAIPANLVGFRDEILRIRRGFSIDDPEWQSLNSVINTDIILRVFDEVH